MFAPEFIHHRLLPKLIGNLKKRFSEALEKSEAFSAADYITEYYSYFKELNTEEFLGKEVADTEQLSISFSVRDENIRQYYVYASIYHEFKFDPEYDNYGFSSFAINCEMILGSTEAIRKSNSYTLKKIFSFDWEDDEDTDENLFWTKVNADPIYQEIKNKDLISMLLYSSWDA